MDELGVGKDRHLISGFKDDKGISFEQVMKEMVVDWTSEMPDRRPEDYDDFLFGETMIFLGQELLSVEPDRSDEMGVILFHQTVFCKRKWS